MTGRQSSIPTRVSRAAATPVDGASLAVVRISLGLVAVLAAARTWAYGWVDSRYADPTHRFTYPFFTWVPQPGPVAMRVLLAVVAASGLAVAVGWRTRVAAAVLAVSFGWVELIDATTYLNHYWFVTLMATLAVVAPVGAAWSLDARRRGYDEPAAAGWIWLVRCQVVVVYAFAGLAKLQGDWLVRALPLKLWLPARADLAVIGPLLDEAWVAHAFSIAGALFDVSVVPLLLWRRTRLGAWFATLAFHAATWVLFPIGVFPLLMAACATVFFAPDWPRTLLARTKGHDPRANFVRRTAPEGNRRTKFGRWAGAFAIGWAAVQVALPLRHLAYPGDHRWTGEAYRFSWNVLLVERTGSVTFVVHEPATGRTWTADPGELYTLDQIRVMSSEPDLIRQAAHAIAAQEAARGHDVTVTVDAWLSLNGRPAERWIDPTVDLSSEPASLAPARWILPAP